MRYFGRKLSSTTVEIYVNSDRLYKMALRVRTKQNNALWCTSLSKYCLRAGRLSSLVWQGHGTCGGLFEMSIVNIADVTRAKSMSVLPIDMARTLLGWTAVESTREVGYPVCVLRATLPRPYLTISGKKISKTLRSSDCITSSYYCFDTDSTNELILASYRAVCM